MLPPAICTAAVLLLPLMMLAQPPQAAAQSTYGCPAAGLQRTLTNYGRFTFRLDLSPANSSFLQANMDCRILILGYSDSRWLITIDYADLSAYKAEFSIQEGGSDGKQVAMVTGTGTSYRQVGIDNGNFYVRLITKSGPVGTSRGVMLTVEHLGAGQCPTDWYTVPGSSSYCYGVPKLAQLLTYTEATKACNLVLANLIMGNFDYDSISAELYAAPKTVLNATEASWVGMYDKDGDLKFLNKYKSMDGITGRMCSYSSDNCWCIAYQAGKFYRDDCDSRHKYVCYMPKGGSSSYYNLDTMMSTATSIIVIVIVVLTVGFVLAVLAGLVVLVVCCCRRRRRRGTVHRSGPAADTAGVVGVSGGLAPPPYPVQAPPYTIPVSSAPPYTSAGAGAAPVYDNSAFAPVGEKPPPYSGDWSEHRVPA